MFKYRHPISSLDLDTFHQSPVQVHSSPSNNLRNRITTTSVPPRFTKTSKSKMPSLLHSMHTSTHYLPVVRRSAGLEAWAMPMVIGIVVVAVVSGAIILCKCCGGSWHRQHDMAGRRVDKGRSRGQRHHHDSWYGR